MEDWAEIRRLRRAEDLFRLDHLATRMRRNAENLVVLSGAAPSRRGRPWPRWRTTPASK